MLLVLYLVQFKCAGNFPKQEKKVFVVNYLHLFKNFSNSMLNFAMMCDLLF